MAVVDSIPTLTAEDHEEMHYDAAAVLIVDVGLEQKQAYQSA